MKSESSFAPEVLTFGCRLNTYESEVIRRNATTAGLKNTVIVNTCAVTAEAERQARQAIRRTRRKHPDAHIIVTGCAAQISPRAFSAMPEVDQILGNMEKLDPAYFEVSRRERVRVNDIMSVTEATTHMVAKFDGRARAFVQIQNGCNHRCTFCIIPFGRGNSRSVPIADVLTESQQLVAFGYQEIVLTGVDIASYGRDLPGEPSLGTLIGQLLRAEPKLARLRLSSLDPAAIDEELWSSLQSEPRLMPHLHFSIQAGDDLILKRMKRRHNRSQVMDCCARARALRPGVTLGADLIAGFPTETDAMFNRTLALVQECELSFLHVFPFSPRENTAAARMPMVPTEIRRARAAQLRAAGIKMRTAILRRNLDHQAEILVEQPNQGRTKHYIPVRLSTTERPGTLQQVHIVGIEGEMLLGETL